MLFNNVAFYDEKCYNEMERQKGNGNLLRAEIN